MTHALHRLGSEENLANDFTIVVRPERGINAEGSIEKTRKILRILYDCGAVNITSARGKNYKGNLFLARIDEIIEGFGDGESIYACFDSQENMERFMGKMVEGDFGLSVVVQGLCTKVKESLARVGLKVHTINHSLGIWGKTDKLPSNEILEITTMCGHGVVSPYLVRDVIESVKDGSMTMEQGAVKLAEPCICGIFNSTRAEELIKNLCS